MPSAISGIRIDSDKHALMESGKRDEYNRAVDNNWAIGKAGELLVRIPNDQRHFRDETLGKVIVLGRKTLATFPQGLPLYGRKNIVLSSDMDYLVKNAVVVHSLEMLLTELKQYRSEDVYIVGERVSIARCFLTVTWLILRK